MNYIVLDLEWNQSMSPNYPVNDNGQSLMFEIMQIGAVKVSEDLRITDTYCAVVKPRYFKQLHYKVREITGMKQSDLKKGRLFLEVIDEFMSWCGENYALLSWGKDDIKVMCHNLSFYNSGIELAESYDMQAMFSYNYELDSTQKSLSNALEYLGIKIDRPLHNALNDAFYSALIFIRLDVNRCIEYVLTQNAENAANGGEQVQKPQKRLVFNTMADAFKDERLNAFKCPVCSCALVRRTEWVRQNRYNYYCLHECKTHGLMAVRLKIYHMPLGKKLIKRAVRVADQQLTHFVKGLY